MGCLDEETILGFCGDRLAGSARVRVEDHIADCDECRALVSAVARSSFVKVGALSEIDDAPSHGTKLMRTGLGEAPDAAELAFQQPGALLRARPLQRGSEQRADGRAPHGDALIDPAVAATTPVGSVSAVPSPSRSPVQPGDVLGGKYEVERVLGAGGMGVVVAARHTQLGQRVALKFLLPMACEVPGAVARFLREGKAAARITSEHVARVMDTGVLDVGAPYLVMEYLEGCDLGALVQRRGPIPADEAIEYVLQACEAIVEAHDLGIVHRDLKPANLFLSHRADGSPLVKVLDFGISKVEGGGSRSHLTSATMLMGSPRYMSPEQMMSAKDVDLRTDVWALGVILYELVCGKPVWEADTMQGLCALIASAPAPSVRSTIPDAPAVLEEVIFGCLAKSREERIASVADFALALDPIAPRTAKTSIERILRVARRDRAAASTPRPTPFGSAESSTSRPVVSAAGSSSHRALQSTFPMRFIGAIGAAAVVLLLAVFGITSRMQSTASASKEPARTAENPSHVDARIAAASLRVSPGAPESVAGNATNPAADALTGAAVGGPGAPAAVGAPAVAGAMPSSAVGAPTRVGADPSPAAPPNQMAAKPASTSTRRPLPAPQPATRIVSAMRKTSPTDAPVEPSGPAGDSFTTKPAERPSVRSVAPFDASRALSDRK